MFIFIFNWRPYWKRSEHITEGINEIVVIIICYMLMIVTDYLDPLYTFHKKTNGYMIIGTITFVALAYIGSIFVGLVMKALRKLYSSY
jgi:hypothetical protein